MAAPEQESRQRGDVVETMETLIHHASAGCRHTVEAWETPRSELDRMTREAVAVMGMVGRTLFRTQLDLTVLGLGCLGAWCAASANGLRAALGAPGTSRRER
ncbi:MAG: hypothetical protein HY815_11270 [Candidatus Riflebacteria bacterium]|nr:hypothetical protein [Candidatus Riflebacteria bacterium]